MSAAQRRRPCSRLGGSAAAGGGQPHVSLAGWSGALLASAPGSVVPLCLALALRALGLLMPWLGGGAWARYPPTLSTRHPLISPASLRCGRRLPLYLSAPRHPPPSTRHQKPLTAVPPLAPGIRYTPLPFALRATAPDQPARLTWG